ncbi:MAG: hypothetical protein M3083_14545 [Actinomycetota bacterium]|nr:hypothetical protein [Actinomycetota bacterium]MDQ6944907.1 hypothetical protein [Actinomycetota bacterium]
MVQSAHPAITGRFTFQRRVASRLGKRLTTTPGRLRLASVAIVSGLLAVAVVGSGAVQARHRATNAVGQQAEPLLVGAQTIYFSLADADATATNTFLQSGLEPPARRQVYLDDLTAATDQLAKLAGKAGTSRDATDALSVITKNLPTYSGFVEAARANNRQGFPVGAAYLREGSALMQTKILPAAGQLYQVEAGRLNRAYDSGQSSLDIAGVLLVALVVLGLLVAIQLFVAQRTNRLLNAPLLVASGLTLVLLAWTVFAFSASGSRLSEARRRGSGPVQLLSSARILVSRAEVDENLALVARGSGSQYLADFDAVTSTLGPADGSSGLLHEAGLSVLPGAGSALVGPGHSYAHYLSAHSAVVKAENTGHFDQAVQLATGAGPNDELPAEAALGANLGDGIRQAQAAFDARAAAAARDLSGLSLGVIALVVVTAVSATVGLQQRINEYR